MNDVLIFTPFDALVAAFDWLASRLRRWRELFDETASNGLENDVMKLIFNATAWANIADNAASSPYTNLYVGLHTADPGEAGNQTTSEATYGSYARVAVARTTGGWSNSSGVVTNVGAVTFPAATSGSNTITYFSIGGSTSGTGYLMFSGALSASLAVSTGITPSFAIGQCSITAD